MNECALVTGAAGFIGGQLCRALLDKNYSVIGVDNFVRGSRDTIALLEKDPGFSFIECDLSSDVHVRRNLLNIPSGENIHEVWHLAANSDISAGVADVSIDFHNTFLTTLNTLTLMRELKIPKMIFASTSAVYGDLKGALREDSGPLLPISNYGAMKLASEGIISAATESYLKSSYIFRFPNVIGPGLTHGAIFDFIHKLKKDPKSLEVLGDGNQQKPYLYSEELIDAMFYVLQNSKNKINLFNIGPADQGIKVVDIAKMVIDAMGGAADIKFTGGNRGWVGDVPRFDYSIEKLNQLGWKSGSESRHAVARTIAIEIKEG
jgi:UDP-glucose 4-epimerase